MDAEQLAENDCRQLGSEVYEDAAACDAGRIPSGWSLAVSAGRRTATQRQDLEFTGMFDAVCATRGRPDHYATDERWQHERAILSDEVSRLRTFPEKTTP
jgi:hypothetical protein